MCNYESDLTPLFRSVSKLARRSLLNTLSPHIRDGFMLTDGQMYWEVEKKSACSCNMSECWNKDAEGKKKNDPHCATEF